MPVRLVLALVFALSAAACGGSDHPADPLPTSASPTVNEGQSSEGANVGAQVGTVSVSNPCGWRGTATYRRVIWIWMENRTYSQVLGGTGDAVRLQHYAQRCGVATNYNAITHPSLPNYIAAVGGSTF